MSITCCGGHYYEVELVCDTKEDLGKVFDLIRDVNGVELGESFARCEHGDMEGCDPCTVSLHILKEKE